MHPFVKLFRTLSVFLIIGLLANHADHDDHADPNTSMFWFSALFLMNLVLVAEGLPHHVQRPVDLVYDAAQQVGAQLVEQPGQQQVQPVVEVRLVGGDQLAQRLQEESEDLGVGVHEHFGEYFCDSLQLRPGQHSAFSEEALQTNQTVLGREIMSIRQVSY